MNLIVSERRFERRLYLGGSLIFFALVFWTFARTFYLKPLFGAPPLPGLLYTHGAVMTGWVPLPVAQTGLVAAHRIHWHRRLGVFGTAWAGLVALFGSVTTLHAAAREVRAHTDFAASQVVITSLDMLQMLFFAGYVAIAIWWSRSRRLYEPLAWRNRRASHSSNRSSNVQFPVVCTTRNLPLHALSSGVWTDSYNHDAPP